jgi:hypothetical protein
MIIYRYFPLRARTLQAELQILSYLARIAVTPASNHSCVSRILVLSPPMIS